MTPDIEQMVEEEHEKAKAEKAADRGADELIARRRFRRSKFRLNHGNRGDRAVAHCRTCAVAMRGRVIAGASAEHQRKG